MSSVSTSSTTNLAAKDVPWYKSWWRSQSPNRKDRFAMVAPMVAVLMFLAAIGAAFSYLRLEEIEREQEAVKRDVEYAQQRLRLQLLERQEQLMRLAAEINNNQIDGEEFVSQAETLVQQFPELQAVVWVDARSRVKMGYTSPSVLTKQMLTPGELLKPGEPEATFSLTREVRQALYSRPFGGSTETAATFQLHVPLSEAGRFAGVVLAEYNIDALMRYAVPSEVRAKHAVVLLSDKGQVLAGNTIPSRKPNLQLLPWGQPPHEYEVPVSPVGNGLLLRATAYSTSATLIGSSLFWLVTVLSLMTAWLLVVTGLHTRRRIQSQAELWREANFRRAMENSLLTGMRVLDMEGRITYVNPAFCQMTLWAENELVGQTAPFSYWPDNDREALTARLEDELQGRTTTGGFQMRVKRKDSSQFDARMYVSPLIDRAGVQTGWMTSMTDITEPNRVRQQLTESYERFTTVLESLDASVSVAPLGSEELLFANKMYRQWFGSRTQGHLNLVAQAGRPEPPRGEADDEVDSLAGLPMGEITSAKSENAEILVTSIGKWLEVRSRYLTWTDGRLAQMVIATDISPRRYAEAQSASQAERAQSASRLVTMGEMASSVAHELNQPLTAINNYCNGMVSRIKGKQINEEDLLGALEKTAKQAQRAGQIIQRIRSFVKRSAPNRTLSDVHTMVSEAVELVDIEMRRRNVRLTHDIFPRLPDLMVDPILIEQVLVNLLKNSAESVDLAQRPHAQRKVHLQVDTDMMDGIGEVVQFVVTDSGNGLAPEVMQRLYEAFFSTKVEGMGIGLNLCRSIVESHQGRMQAQNLYNGDTVTGCKFSFWLPLAMSSAPESKTFEQSGAKSATN